MSILVCWPKVLQMFSQFLSVSHGTWLLNSVKTFRMPCMLALKVDAPKPVSFMPWRKYFVRFDVLSIKFVGNVIYLGIKTYIEWSLNGGRSCFHMMPCIWATTSFTVHSESVSAYMSRISTPFWTTLYARGQSLHAYTPQLKVVLYNWQSNPLPGCRMRLESQCPLDHAVWPQAAPIHWLLLGQIVCEHMQWWGVQPAAMLS